MSRFDIFIQKLNDLEKAVELRQKGIGLDFDDFFELNNKVQECRTALIMEVVELVMRNKG